MDDRRMELQIRAILVTYRVEKRRADSHVMEEFRRRADVILARLEAEAGADADVVERIAGARRELDGTPPPSGEHPR